MKRLKVWKAGRGTPVGWEALTAVLITSTVAVCYNDFFPQA